MKIHGNIGNRAGLAPLKSALEAYALRHRTIAGNIANAETPGYRPRRVEFEKFARQAMAAKPRVELATSNARHLTAGPVRDEVIEAKVETPPTGEAEGVDVEKELVAMVENQLSYRLAVRMLEMKYRQLHSAITGSNR